MDDTGKDQTARQPSILLVSTQPWLFPARMAMVLKRAGCHVEGASPRGSPLYRSSAVATRHRLNGWSLLSDLENIIRRVRPDRIIPCDDLATNLLVRLHEVAAIRPIIETSLGNPASFTVLLSKGAQMVVAKELALPMPATAYMADRAAYRAATASGDLPKVLKVDGSFGGQGVAVVHDLPSADAAWERLTRAPTLWAAIKCAVGERSSRALTARHHWRVSRPHLQAFADGKPANCAVYCDRGRVVAGFSVLAVETDGAYGPASVVRVIDHPRMIASAEALVAHLGLSGFHGLDFILTPDGDALFLELNPRATPICHLIAPGGHGLVAAMVGSLGGSLGESLGGSGNPMSVLANGETIALFPNELARDQTSPHLDGWHDVPWDDLPMVRFALRRLAITRSWDKLLLRVRTYLPKPIRNPVGLHK